VGDDDPGVVRITCDKQINLESEFEPEAVIYEFTRAGFKMKGTWKSPSNDYERPFKGI